MMKKIALFTLILFLPILAGCALSNKEAATPAEPAEGSPMTLSDGSYILNVEESTVYWTAYKPVGGHMGNISLKSGELVVKNGQPQSGSFEMDMDSITNTDIENESTRTSLVNHLKSDDFFSVADYKAARFDITKVTTYQDIEGGGYEIKGDLSLKDITDSVTIYAQISEENGQLSAQGRVDVDRTKYGITVRSGSFFEKLGDKLIKDEFSLELELVTSRM